MEIKKVTRTQVNNVDACFVVEYVSGVCREYQKMTKSIEKFINDSKVSFIIKQFGQRKHIIYAIYLHKKQNDIK